MADELAPQDRDLARTLVNGSLEQKLKDESSNRAAHKVLFDECMNSEMMPYMRQASQTKNETLDEVQLCQEQAKAGTPIYKEALSRRQAHGLSPATDNFSPKSEAKKLIGLVEDRFTASDKSESKSAACALSDEWLGLDQTQRNSTWSSIKRLSTNQTAIGVLLSSEPGALSLYAAPTAKAEKDDFNNVKSLEFSHNLLSFLKLEPLSFSPDQAKQELKVKLNEDGVDIFAAQQDKPGTAPSWLQECGLKPLAPQ